MNEIVAVVNNASFPFTLKQLLLMADKIAYPEYSLEAFPPGLVFMREDFLQFRADLEFLASQRLLFDPLPDPEEYSFLKDQEYSALRKQLVFCLDEHTKAADVIKKSSDAIKNSVHGVKVSKDPRVLSVPTGGVTSGETFPLIKDHLDNTDSLYCAKTKLGDIMALVSSVYLREIKNMRAIPFLHSWANIPDEPNHKKATVAEIVFESFPVPDNSVPLEALIDFKRDPDTIEKFLRLRRWMRRISTEDLPAIDIQEEIESLVAEYKAHMEVHRMKINKGAFETIVTLAAEALENIAKLKLAKVAKSFFHVRERQIALREAELRAPGREIAYLLKAQEAFGPS